MRVGLNATCLNERPSGAKQRFVGIYGALFQRLPDVEFVIFEPRDCSVAGWFAGQANVTGRRTPVPSMGRLGKFWAGLDYWQQAFAGGNFDLFEGMHLPFVRPKQGIAILTIHDVRGLHAENGVVQRTLFATVLRKALQRADHVVTVSEAMRAEILAFYPYTPVSVIYNGLDAGVFAGVTQDDCEAFLVKYKLPRDFVLAVGHFEQRKNYPRLIEALARLKRRGIDCPLVIVGNDSGEGTLLARQIATLNLGSRVSLLSGLPDLELRCAYMLCSLFVFPSSYEGFGIPILEAMAAQRPMVLSNLPVFEEITEGQSIYFPAGNVEAMADAIELGLSSNEARDRMVEYGSRRVAEFSFDKLADGLAQVHSYFCASSYSG
ncbi:MAG TPA: glycosyltransferase family 1 protein [Gammaproteobacteria bacterium]|nr:glycosyltransferase family 1 protein [Gammaproteobacteria bacterium]